MRTTTYEQWQSRWAIKVFKDGPFMRWAFWDDQHVDDCWQWIGEEWAEAI